MDTPGILPHQSHTAKKLSMSKEFVRGPSHSLMEADMSKMTPTRIVCLFVCLLCFVICLFVCLCLFVVVVIVDASNKRTRERLDLNILNELQRYLHIPSLLVLNKV